ncbi:MAG: hypothetical protein V1914_03330 [archaeon]
MAEPSKDEQIGIHKGSISVLAQERQELVKIISITEQLMQMHIKALKELGVDLEAEAKKAKEAMQKQQAAPGTPQTPPKTGEDDLANRLG